MTAGSSAEVEARRQLALAEQYEAAAAEARATAGKYGIAVSSVKRTRGTRWPAVPLLVVLGLSLVFLAGCTSYGSSNDRVEPPVTCDDVLASVVHRVRVSDTAGAFNREVDWLRMNCPDHFDVATEYMSARGMAELGPSDSCQSWMQYIGHEAIALLSEEGLCSGGSAGSPADGAGPPEQPGGGIPWNEALDYVDTSQRVCGPFVGAGSSDDDVFLDVGRPYPDPARFKIVLWDTGGLEPIREGVTLCTSGLITTYEGVAQIELRSPELVEIYE